MSIVLLGSTSGSCTLQEQAVAGTTTLTLPTFNGTVGLLVSGTAVASTSGTTVEFTSIPAGVRRITVMFQGVSTNGTGSFQVQIGSGSYTISGYASNLSTIGAATVVTGSGTTGFFVSGGVAGTTLSGILVMTNITGNTWTYVSNTARTDTTTTNNAAGNIALGGVLDRLRVIASSTGSPADTFDAGTINILYE
jgi:hypothetical protein